jgi:hypothetical protein
LTGASPACAAAAACVARKTGDSSMEMRMYIPTSTSTALSRNGMRHPQDSNCAVLVVAVTTASTATASIWPAGAPACGQEA